MTDNAITVEVQVPVDVPSGQKHEFINAVVEFLLGRDRIRPEFTRDLEAAGVDLRQLATLSDTHKIGVCSDPDALEFVPDETLMELAKKKKLDLTSGGNLRIHFNFDAKKVKDPKKLELILKLPENVGAVNEKQLGSIVQALFGDCELSSRAQEYLHVHKISLTDLERKHAKALADGEKPLTSRVSPEVGEFLAKFGLRTDQYGDLVVTSEGIAKRVEGAIAWSRRTCC